LGKSAVFIGYQIKPAINKYKKLQQRSILEHFAGINVGWIGGRYRRHLIIK
jgi:hypothetical protein